MGLIDRFFRQFQRPEDSFLGHAAGQLMAATTGGRNEWTLSLLKIRPDDRILEIGYGPGVGILLASQKVREGIVVGIDPSEAMRKQAERRNRRAIREKKVRLFTGNIEDWPGFDHSFTRIFSVNSAPFWTDRIRVFQKLHGWLEPGGLMAVAFQPLGKDAPDLDATCEQLTDEMKQAGFVRIRRETKPFRAAPAVCLIAERAKSR
ncbi:methyltransferase family protein [Planifilum fimeticola]|uniref:Methyltransferase family protein n=1 Tax=Planifilum fimeticola TaxID=201975 RepID=A0A2T0LEY7_9BACL|nr:class I SAM-dependent methyltransferase [Planifilum fimeticola]PRX40715.1 methyltransferase family protein [Planifilum fimeticola]